MKVLTLNTWQERGPWEKRWELILKGIAQWKPDIVAFQELFNHSWAQMVQKVSGFPMFLFPEEHCGLVLYTNQPVSSWGVVKLASSPLEDYSRYALWAQLKIKQGSIFVVNTHLSWQLEDGATRMRQIDELIQLIHQKASKDDSILVGDLNASPRTPEIQHLIRKGGFHDLYHGLHLTGSGFTWDNRNPYAAGSTHKMPDRRIDYVMARGVAHFLKSAIFCDLVYTHGNSKGIWASDHFGVLAEFRT